MTDKPARMSNNGRLARGLPQFGARRPYIRPEPTPGHAMTTTTERDIQGRGPGLLLIASAILTVGLLAAHPGDNATTFADVLKSEAAGQLMDAVVHGGFIVVLAVQIFCYALFSARMKISPAAATAGLVFFCVGTGFLSASMLLDGLVTPALAVKYLAAPAKIEFAKSLFALVGTLIRFLMPIGLAFQSAAMAAWGLALWAGHKSRAAGAFGLIAGLLLLVAFGATASTMNPAVLMSALPVLAIWAAVTGTVMLRR